MVGDWIPKGNGGREAIVDAAVGTPPTACLLPRWAYGDHVVLQPARYSLSEAHSRWVGRRLGRRWRTANEPEIVPGEHPSLQGAPCLETAVVAAAAAGVRSYSSA
jgi:hypothetical protein